MKINRLLFSTLGLSFLILSVAKGVAPKPDGHYKDLGISKDGYKRFSLVYKNHQKTHFYFVGLPANSCHDACHDTCHNVCFRVEQQEVVMGDTLADLAKTKDLLYKSSYREMDAILDGCKRFSMHSLTCFGEGPVVEFFVAQDGRFWIVNRRPRRNLHFCSEEERKKEAIARKKFIAREKEKFASIIDMLCEEGEGKQ
ncbi:hypothetical protein ACFLYU_01965 [Candidatus Dependentiae bacterium]